MKNFSERLYLLIEKKGLQQNTFAGAAGFDTTQVNKWLANQTKTPQRKTLKKISEYFGCDIDWLATGEGQPFKTTHTAEGDSIFQEKRNKQLAEEDRNSMSRLRFKMQCGSVYFDEFFDFLAEEYGESKEGADDFMQWLHTNHAVYRHWLAEKKQTMSGVDDTSPDKVSVNGNK